MKPTPFFIFVMSVFTIIACASLPNDKLLVFFGIMTFAAGAGWIAARIANKEANMKEPLDYDDLPANLQNQVDFGDEDNQ